MAETTSIKAQLIEEILKIEIPWFLTVNPYITSECQLHPDVFKLMRQSPYETWSEETLALHLKRMAIARDTGRNLVRDKYAKMQDTQPILNNSPALLKSVEIEEKWFQAAREKYPWIIGAAGGEGFKKYLRCELDTFSQETLDSYYQDRLAADKAGRNLVIEAYDGIARKMGYQSIDDWNEKQGRGK